ncbi:hypothetical protein FMEAI12_6960009 [Parafrankia sp. Ea1.12]|nr:hypothetical protein FMEAI12_6960009 [Parafrankia sp. Ea1.12]
MSRDSEDMGTAGGVFDDEEHVDPSVPASAGEPAAATPLPESQDEELYLLRGVPTNPEQLSPRALRVRA